MKPIFKVIIIFLGAFHDASSQYLTNSEENKTSASEQWRELNSLQKKINCIALSGTKLFAGTNSGIYQSTNNGGSWNSLYGVRVNVTPVDVSCIGFSGTNIFAGTFGNGVFVSNDSGISWKVINSWATIGLTNDYSVMSLAIQKGNIFIGTYGGVFFSNNNGSSWVNVSTGIYSKSQYAYPSSFAISDSNIFVSMSEEGGVFLFNRNSNSWTEVNNGLTNIKIQSLASSIDKIYVGTLGGGMFESTNNGSNWSEINNGLTNKYVQCLSVIGNNIFAGTLGGVFLSIDNGRTWTAINSELKGAGIRSLIVNMENIFAVTDESRMFLFDITGSTWASWFEKNKQLLDKKVYEDKQTIEQKNQVVITQFQNEYKSKIQDYKTSFYNNDKQDISEFISILRKDSFYVCRQLFNLEYKNLKVNFKITRSVNYNSADSLLIWKLKSNYLEDKKNPELISNENNFSVCFGYVKSNFGEGNFTLYRNGYISIQDFKISDEYLYITDLKLNGKYYISAKGHVVGCLDCEDKDISEYNIKNFNPKILNWEQTSSSISNENSISIVGKWVNNEHIMVFRTDGTCYISNDLLPIDGITLSISCYCTYTFSSKVIQVTETCYTELKDKMEHCFFIDYSIQGGHEYLIIRNLTGETFHRI